MTFVRSSVLLTTCMALCFAGACESDESSSADGGAREDGGQQPAPDSGEGMDAAGEDPDAAGEMDAAGEDPDSSVTSDAGISAVHIPSMDQLMNGDCPEPTGSGTDHNANITSDETWTAAGSPHRIMTSLRISADVTVEACARVVLSEGASLQVGGGVASEAGSLTARGEFSGASSSPEVARLVVFMSEGDEFKWGELRVEANSTLDLEMTALLYGGAPGVGINGGGSPLAAIGNADGTRTENVRAQGLFIIASGSAGVRLLDGGAFTSDSSDVAIVGADGTDPYSMRVDTPSVGSLPQGSYENPILVGASRPCRVDETFRNLGVPYRVAGPFEIAPSDMSETLTLTIEPGVTLHVEDRIFVGDSNGGNPLRAALVAQGTAEQPITFTSSEEAPSAGDWAGIFLEAIPASGNALEHATIEYAGGESGTASFGCGPSDNDAALLIFERPDDAFIQNTTFRNNLGETTIVSAWVSDEAGPDLVTGNEFDNTGGTGGTGCLQSLWRTTETNYCPTSEGPHCAE